MERTVFIVRLGRRDADGSWHGEVEQIGDGERHGLTGPAELVDFIERRLATGAEGGTGDGR